jgi:hypothetical protein
VTSLKEGYKGRKDGEEEDSYWMTFKKREDVRN